jgi:uncharacterized RmlC-like cupin family protein
MPNNIALPQSAVVVVKTQEEAFGRQKLPFYVGISAETVGATGISMNLVVIPPGGAAQAHRHRKFESAVYILRGRIEIRYGSGLRQSMLIEAGSFFFVPADLPHQPVNLSPDEPVHMLVARNDPNEQENVVPYDPASDD